MTTSRFNKFEAQLFPLRMRVLLILLALLMSADYSHSFSQPKSIHANVYAGLAGDPSIATNGNGTWIAVWPSRNTLEGTAGTDYDILISVSKNDGSLWSAPAVVHSYANHDDAGDLEPEIATNGNGTWIITWRSSYDTGFIGSDTDILMSMSNNDGETWSSPTAINSNATSDNFLFGLTEYLPLVVSNGADTWVVAWSHYDGNVGSDDKHLQYTVSHDNGLSWSLESQLSNSPIYYVNQQLSIASNGSGTWIATWASIDTHSGTVGTDFDVMYSISTDDARSWSAPFPLNHYAATDGGYDDDTSPSIATDRDGNWFVV